MTSAEMKSLSARRDRLERRFKLKYPTPFTVREGKPCFLADNGHYFLVTAVYFDKHDGFIVIEHADSLQEAMLPRFEDGDLYYMDDMTEDEMFEAMVREIENS